MDLAKTHRNITVRYSTLNNSSPSRRDIMDAFDQVYNRWFSQVEGNDSYSNTITQNGVRLSINIGKVGLAERRCKVNDFNRLLRALKLEALGQIG